MNGIPNFAEIEAAMANALPCPYTTGIVKSISEENTNQLIDPITVIQNETWSSIHGKIPGFKGNYYPASSQ